MTLPLSRRAFSLGAAALPLAPAIGGKAPKLQTGLDRLVAGEGRSSMGGRIALLTHAGARDASGRRSVDAVAEVAGKKLLGLLSPEHGLDGKAAAGAAVPDGRDAATGLPVYSLYGQEGRRPQALLDQIDTIMVDLQDVGLRPFTYAATMIDVLHMAQQGGKQVYLLDRPNPLGGAKIDGPFVDPALASKVSALPTPFRHGLTITEVAVQVYANENMRFDIGGLAMKGWNRSIASEVFAPGGLAFTPPSPNLPSPAAVLAYAATVLVEGTNLSEGRGTPRPFETIGAPWCDGPRLAAAMTLLKLPGVRFAAGSFTPKSSKHAGKRCGGVQFSVTDEQAYDPLLTGLSLVAAVRQLHPKQFAFLQGQRPFFDLLIGQTWVREALLAGDAPAAIMQRWQGDVARFRRAAVHIPDYD